MKLSAKTLEHLISIITGDTNVSPYRSGPQLVAFFNQFGENDLYGQGFPTRHVFVREKLEKLNGSHIIEDITCAAFDFFGDKIFNAEDAAYQFNRYLASEGFKLVLVDDYGWMEGNSEVRINHRFEVLRLSAQMLSPNSLRAINHEAITEQIRKAHQKVESGDYSGAITNAYTLVEHVLKYLLQETNTPFKETEGDIRGLYRALQPSLNVHPSNLEEPLKPIASAFQTLIGGIYGIANKGSDRHARQFNPARHHAKLAINAAFALCDFLIDSLNYQRGH